MNTNPMENYPNKKFVGKKNMILHSIIYCWMFFKKMFLLHRALEKKPLKLNNFALRKMLVFFRKNFQY